MPPSPVSSNYAAQSSWPEPHQATDRRPLPVWITHSQTLSTDIPPTNTPDRRFYYFGRIIAVLELGARAQVGTHWHHLYYTYGLIPSAGLSGPLQKGTQSELPDLQRKGRAALYQETLDSLARDLQEASRLENPNDSFDSWASQVLKDRGFGEHCALPTNSTPGDAPAYTQGYLDHRKALQPKRPAAPPTEEAEQYSWQYHLGRTLTWNGAGNYPHLSEAFQLGIKARRTLCAHDKKR